MNICKTIFIPIIFLIPLTFWGCSANKSDRSRSDRARASMNERDYISAIASLEEQLRESPEDKQAAFLLAQAHSGAAGLEIFSLIRDLMARQNVMEGLDLAFNVRCDNNALDQIGGNDFKCLLLRLVRHFPQPDNAHMIAARSILRSHFSNPRLAPPEINFFSAFLELGSVLERFRLLLERSMVDQVNANYRVTPAELPFGFLIHHLKNIFTELSQGLKRARYAYSRVSNFVVTNNGRPLFRVGRRELLFSESIELEDAFRFGLQLIQDRTRNIDETVNDELDHRLGGQSVALINLLRQVDNVQFGGELGNKLHFSISVGQTINRLLTSVIRIPQWAPGDFQGFEYLYDYPPVILVGLRSALTQAWDSEESRPIQQYLLETKDQWNEGNRILAAWQEWADHIDQNKKAPLLGYLGTVVNHERTGFRRQQELSVELFRSWQAHALQMMANEAAKVFRNEITTIPAFTPSESSQGEDLMAQSVRWISNNIYPPSAAAAR